MEDAVELTGAGDVLRALADFEGLLENLFHGSAGFGRAGDEGGIVEEKQFAAGVGGRFFEARGLVGSGVVEVEFIEDDEAGFFLIDDRLGDLAVLGRDAGGDIDDQHAEVGAANGLFGAHRGKDFDRVVAFAAWAESGGIDEREVFSLERAGQIDRIAGSAGDVGDDRAFVLEDGVGE